MCRPSAIDAIDRRLALLWATEPTSPAHAAEIERQQEVLRDERWEVWNQIFGFDELGHKPVRTEGPGWPDDGPLRDCSYQPLSASASTPLGIWIVNVAGLRELAESLPAGTAVPVPREWLLEILGGKLSPVGDDLGSTPLPSELTQREAARLLRVSVSYLRASSCPKHLLPGNGKKGKALVRYRRDEVLAWGAARQQARTHLRAS